MGLRASETGVTLRFLDPTGTAETQDPVTGEFAFLFSKPRLEFPGSSEAIHGSHDWLTDLIVVDNPVKLSQYQLTQSGIAFSSAASKQVLVRWDVGAQHSDQGGSFTIATGHKTAGSDFLFADTILVLPAQTNMNPTHRLWPLWAQMATQLLAAVENRLFALSKIPFHK